MLTPEEILKRHEQMAKPIPEGFTRFGTRNAAGRPTVEDKKKQVNVMVKGSLLETLGKKKIQEIMLNALEAHVLEHNIDQPSSETSQPVSRTSELDLLG